MQYLAHVSRHRSTEVICPSGAERRRAHRHRLLENEFVSDGVCTDRLTARIFGKIPDWKPRSQITDFRAFRPLSSRERLLANCAPELPHAQEMVRNRSCLERFCGGIRRALSSKTPVTATPSAREPSRKPPIMQQRLSPQEGGPQEFAVLPGVQLRLHGGTPKNDGQNRTNE